MKKTLFVFVINLLFAVACNNSQTEKVEKTKKDSILLSVSKSMDSIKHPNKGFNAPSSFLGLSWLISKQEALMKLKHKDSLKIIRVFDYGKRGHPEIGEVIKLSGFFAGQRVKNILLTFYLDKFCVGEVNFGIKERGFKDNLVKQIESKYGKSKYNDEWHDYIWDFDNYNRYHKRTPFQIRLYEDNYQLILNYYSVDSDVFLDQIKAIQKSQEEKSLKSHDL